MRYNDRITLRIIQDHMINKVFSECLLVPDGFATNFYMTSLGNPVRSYKVLGEYMKIDVSGLERVFLTLRKTLSQKVGVK